jgi:hypothetical protein
MNKEKGSKLNFTLAVTNLITSIIFFLISNYPVVGVLMLCAAVIQLIIGVIRRKKENNK